MTPPRIVFVGCVAEGRECLQEILQAGGNVVAVVTFTDELARKTSGAVSFESTATEHGIPLYKVRSTNTPESIALLKELTPDVIFVVGWTRLVSAEALRTPSLGCIGMHASLLPKYRGRAPVNWAIINDEKETGNTMLLLDDGVDTGDILLQKRIRISFSDTCETLYAKVARAGREMIREIMPFIASGRLPRKPQQHELATVMPARKPEDGLIDWRKSSRELYNWVRALTHPYPGAFTLHNERQLLIWQAHPSHFPEGGSGSAAFRQCQPGEVISVSDGITVATGSDDLLTVRRLSYANEPEMLWQGFIEQSSINLGDILG